MPRYFHRFDDFDADRIELTGAEARHAARVRRVNIGELISLFDGEGFEAVGVVASVDRDSLTISLTQRQRVAPPSGARLTIAVATPKGDRAEWIVEKCAELGVAELIPLTSQRGVVQPGGGKLEKWQRIAREANKQSGRNDLMTIAEPTSIDELIAANGGSAKLWLADADGESPQTTWMAIADSEPVTRHVALIGPEGGFAPTESEALITAGARRVTVGAHILRVETAAVACAAVWAASRHRFDSEQGR